MLAVNIFVVYGEKKRCNRGSELWELSEEIKIDKVLSIGSVGKVKLLCRVRSSRVEKRGLDQTFRDVPVSSFVDAKKRQVTIMQQPLSS